MAAIALLTLPAPLNTRRVTLMVCPWPRRRFQWGVDDGGGERQRWCLAAWRTTRCSVGTMRGTVRWVNGGTTPRGHFPWQQGNAILTAVAILAANVTNMSATCCKDTRFCSNFGQMGRCRRHKIEDVGTFCVGLSRHPYFPPNTRPAQVRM
jgi:hypothetical protein